MTKLFVGLGNPGDKYSLNRHNIGFMMLDAFAHYENFPSFKEGFKGLHTKKKIDDELCILLKPETFMNLSGESVQSCMAFHKIHPDDIVVFHDELDLEPFEMRIKKGGGSAGHNGLKSISKHVGPDYWRVRFGIGHPGVKELISNYVLSNFSKEEKEKLPDILEKIGLNINQFLCPEVQAISI